MGLEAGPNGARRAIARGLQIQFCGAGGLLRTRRRRRSRRLQIQFCGAGGACRVGNRPAVSVTDPVLWGWSFSIVVERVAVMVTDSVMWGWSIKHYLWYTTHTRLQIDHVGLEVS